MTNRVVLLGNFDGVHIGHRALINKGVSLAKENGLICAVWTFDSLASPYLSSVDERSELFYSLGVDEVVLSSFASVRDMSAEDFVKNILKDKLNAKICVCGYNYSFGKGGKGTPMQLKSLCAEYGIDVFVLDEVLSFGEKISSSRIRELLSNGEAEKANVLLGRNFVISGMVVCGAGLGRTVGMPTANIDVENGRCLPSNGVYATACIIDGKRYPSITNIGLRPTMNDGRGRSIESYILDFKTDIYGKEIKLEFLSFLREEKKFESIADVKSAVQNDIIKARKAFAGEDK